MVRFHLTQPVYRRMGSGLEEGELGGRRLAERRPGAFFQLTEALAGALHNRVRNPGKPGDRQSITLRGWTTFHPM